MVGTTSEGMHEYDIALKSILMRRTGSLLTRITGLTVARWHNIEFPEVRNRRADLMGETAEGEFVHVELQSTNDSDMAQRMLEYSAAANRAFGRFPHQLVLYVGAAPARMGTQLSGPGIAYEFRVFDIRELDSEVLLASPDLGDNTIAILARLADGIEAVRRILRMIGENEPGLRTRAITELMLIAGLRDLEDTIEREIDRMPILNDIMDHKVFGRERRRGIAEGERIALMAVMARRFGPVPAWARERVESLGSPELEPLMQRVLDAVSLEDLLA